MTRRDWLIAAVVGLTLGIFVAAAVNPPPSSTVNVAASQTKVAAATVHQSPPPSHGSSTAEPAATATDTPANPGDEFIGWTGAMSAALRLCGLAAHQIVWTHYDMPMVQVYPEADTPTHGCDWAADQLSYDTVPFSLPDNTLTPARDKLVKWSHTLADAYRNTDSPSPDLLDQAAQYKQDALDVIVAEGNRLHRPVDADTLLPAGQTWDSTTASNTPTVTNPGTANGTTSGTPLSNSQLASDEGGTGPTAECNDSTTSYSHHPSGTCSHHGGVATWDDHLPHSTP